MTRFKPDAETYTVTDLPPQAEQIIGQTQVQLRKKHVQMAIAGVVIYKVQKRLVKKVVTEVVRKELPNLLSSELVGMTLNDKFGIIGTLAKAAKV